MTRKACLPSNSSEKPLDFEWSIDPQNPNLQFRKLPSQYLATRLSAQLTLPANFLKVIP